MCCVILMARHWRSILPYKWKMHSRTLTTAIFFRGLCVWNGLVCEFIVHAINRKEKINRLKTRSVLLKHCELIWVISLNRNWTKYTCPVSPTKKKSISASSTQTTIFLVYVEFTPLHWHNFVFVHMVACLWHIARLIWYVFWYDSIQTIHSLCIYKSRFWN